MKEVYVCVRETPDEGENPVGVYDNEESAREWIRQKFMEFKAKNPNDKCACDNGNYHWGEGESDIVSVDGAYEWYCYYELESYGWYVFKLPVRK